MSHVFSEPRILNPGWLVAAGPEEVPAVLMKASLLDLAYSSAFWAALLGWLVAQVTKMLCNLAATGKISFRYLVSTGGMPSAHCAMVSALGTAVGWQCGWGSPVFALALGFALLTMFDASTVRRAAGQQARLLNEIIEELFHDKHLSEKKLKELLGHTRLEVFMGMVVGVLVALIVSLHAVPAVWG